ncbi:hypothetical protein GZH53_03570 [Flavihumibacter sp. R14]|nr:hypothetical protein [Flavihumibacter soli]
MKYLVFFLVLSSVNLFSYTGHSTVVYLQSSKAKNVKLAKSKAVKITKKCPVEVKKLSTPTTAVRNR